MTADVTISDDKVRDTSAVAAGSVFGLYPASDFRLADGLCTDCPAIAQALWYFRSEVIAVAKPGRPVASYATGVPVTEDLGTWLAGRDPAADPEYPPLVWVAAPHVVHGTRLSPDAAVLECGGESLHASLVPKIALNRSWFDGTSAEFFRSRTLKVRGTIDDGAIAIRTLWPEDFRLDRSPPLHASEADVPPALALRGLMRAEAFGGARSPYAVSTLWQRHPEQEPISPPIPPGRAVLGFIVNGAQGDDDEAHGGHFALVTGRTRHDGAIGDWLVNNFYALDSESEKGIIAAPVPLDNYLADLNSGQGWYRPSQLLVLVLADDSAAALVQAALNRVYNQFWRHQLAYRHASMNCAGISVDVLRALGWDIPVRGPAGRIAAALGFPYVAVKERSIDKARVAFDYLTEDQTRLLPAAAFEECGAAALELANSRKDDGTSRGALPRMLANDIEAIAFIRVPQFPSSRAFGDAPVVTPWEFQKRLPADRSKMQIIPVPPRPFPDSLRAPDLVAAKRPASDYAAAAWGFLLLIGIPLLILALLSG